MKVVIQRVSKASVHEGSEQIGSIEKGLLVLLGIQEGDTKEDQDWLVKKILGLRIFPDTKGMNLSIQDVSGELLVVSQFTLHASTKKGNRPSFLKAAKPDIANTIYSEFVSELERVFGNPIQTGRFGADMEVQLTNWGPVTIIIDSKNRE